MWKFSLTLLFSYVKFLEIELLRVFTDLKYLKDTVKLSHNKDKGSTNLYNL